MSPAVPAEVLAVDRAALDAAAMIAEEALACHREALILLAEGWQSETGSAIADFMDGQCAHATDVVDALRRASGPTSAAPDSWTDPGLEPDGGRMVDSADALPLTTDIPRPAPDPGIPTPLPAQSPGSVSAWTGQVPAPPSLAPTAADTPWSTAAVPGGMPTPPALPDLGSTLVGLVSEIAQALGSYADIAPAADLVASPDAAVGTRASAVDGAGEAEATVGRQEPPKTTLTDDDAPGSGSASPGSAAPTTPTAGPVTTAPPPSPALPAPPPSPAPPSPPPAPPSPAPAPTELLAAERPPAPTEPAPPAEAPSGAGVPAAPRTPPAPPKTAPAAAAPPAEQTPCEIAADELANVGE